MSTANLDNVKKKYQFKNISIATWRDPSLSIHPARGGPASPTFPANAVVRPFVPTYKVKYHPVLALTNDEESEDSSDDESGAEAPLESSEDPLPETNKVDDPVPDIVSSTEETVEEAQSPGPGAEEGDPQTALETDSAMTGETHPEEAKENEISTSSATEPTADDPEEAKEDKISTSSGTEPTADEASIEYSGIPPERENSGEVSPDTDPDPQIIPGTEDPQPDMETKTDLQDEDVAPPKDRKGEEKKVAFAPETPEPHLTPCRKRSGKGGKGKKKKKVLIPIENSPPDVSAMVVDSAVQNDSPPPASAASTEEVPPSGNKDDVLVAGEGKDDTPADGNISESAPTELPIASSDDAGTKEKLENAAITDEEEAPNGNQDGEAPVSITEPVAEPGAIEEAPVTDPSIDVESTSGNVPSVKDSGHIESAETLLDEQVTNDSSAPGHQSKIKNSRPLKEKSKRNSSKSKSKAHSTPSAAVVPAPASSAPPPIQSSDDTREDIDPSGENTEEAPVELVTEASSNSPDEKKQDDPGEPVALEKDDAATSSVDSDGAGKTQASPPVETLVTRENETERSGEEEVHDQQVIESEKTSGHADVTDPDESLEESNEALKAPETSENGSEADSVTSSEETDTPEDSGVYLEEEGEKNRPPVEFTGVEEEESSSDEDEGVEKETTLEDTSVEFSNLEDEPGEDTAAPDKKSEEFPASADEAVEGLTGDGTESNDTVLEETITEDANVKDAPMPEESSTEAPREAILTENLESAEKDDDPSNDESSLPNAVEEGSAKEESPEPPAEDIPTVDKVPTVEESSEPPVEDIQDGEAEAVPDVPTAEAGEPEAEAPEVEEPEAEAPLSPVLSKSGSTKSKTDHWERKHAESPLQDIFKDSRVLQRPHGSKGKSSKDEIRVTDRRRKSRSSPEEEEERRIRRREKRAEEAVRAMETERRRAQEERERSIRREEKKAARAMEKARMIREDAEAAYRREVQAKSRRRRDQDGERSPPLRDTNREAKRMFPRFSLPQGLKIETGESVHGATLVRSLSGGYRPAKERPPRSSESRHRDNTDGHPAVDVANGEVTEPRSPNESRSHHKHRRRHHGPESDRTHRSRRDSINKTGRPNIEERPRSFFGALMKGFK